MGAGRKPGAATAKTREIADKVAASGDTPLEALGELRRWAMEKFRAAVKVEDFLTAVKAAEVAADWANKEAPYVHPRLSAVDANLTGEAKFIIEVAR